jgi:hypothetical protein
VIPSTDHAPCLEGMWMLVGLAEKVERAFMIIVAEEESLGG